MSAREFHSLFRVPAERRIVLYLGRLHPVKGLPRLLQAWAQIQQSVVSGPLSRGPWSRGLSSGTWHLVLAGPDEAGHRSVTEARAGRTWLQRQRIFTGALDGYQKWGALDAAELFVMPSDFENFGVAIAEAMQSGFRLSRQPARPGRNCPPKVSAGASNPRWMR